MDYKLIGSILLIVGTSIGAGMLALPIATANLGFLGSLILLFVCWFVMTAGAFLLLEINLCLPLNSNISSMAKLTLGPLGQFLAWVTYFLLLYSLLCAYIAGGSDLLHNLFLTRHFDIPKWASTTLFTLFFGSIVYLGIRAIDYTNRGLMFVKLLAFILLLLLAFPFVSSYNLMAGDFSYLTHTTALTVTITSFGFATIVPSLRIYFANDVNKLKKAIWIGSLIPLVCYILWDLTIMGIIPLQGEHSLQEILKSNSSTSDFVNTFSHLIRKPAVTVFANLFTSICVLTSFLGVSLCLTDFLADGFKLSKEGFSNFFIHLVTFLPPLVIVLFFPNAFIKGLEYAGIYCVILLILLPALMSWRGRDMRLSSESSFRVPGGKMLLLFLILFSVFLIAKALIG